MGHDREVRRLTRVFSISFLLGREGERRVSGGPGRTTWVSPDRGRAHERRAAVWAKPHHHPGSTWALHRKLLVSHRLNSCLSLGSFPFPCKEGSDNSVFTLFKDCWVSAQGFHKHWGKWSTDAFLSTVQIRKERPRGRQGQPWRTSCHLRLPP